MTSRIGFEADGKVIWYGFESGVEVEHIDGELVRLTRPLVYRSPAFGRLEVPRGLIFDGASIPRWAWSFMPSKTATLEEGALHDWLYRGGIRLGYDREAADYLIWEALDISQDGYAWQRRAVHGVLRAFGWAAWNNWREIDLDPHDPATLITFTSFGDIWTDGDKEGRL